MTFAEHAVAQVLREVATEVYAGGKAMVLTDVDLAVILRKIAQKLSPKPPGEK